MRSFRSWGVHPIISHAEGERNNAPEYIHAYYLHYFAVIRLNDVIFLLRIFLFYRKYMYKRNWISLCFPFDILGLFHSIESFFRSNSFWGKIKVGNSRVVVELEDEGLYKESHRFLINERWFRCGRSSDCFNRISLASRREMERMEM